MPEPYESTSKSWLGGLSVVAAYALFAGLWIAFSDPLLGMFVTDHDLLIRASMIKGWVFVGVTTLLLAGLVARLVARIDAAHEKEMALEREQQRASRLLNTIADSASDAVFAKDLDGRYLFVNAATCDFLGKSRQEIIGQDDRALFPPDQAARLIETNRRIIATAQTITDEEALDTAHGLRYFNVTKGPLRDEAGRIFGTFGSSRDITRRRDAEQALRDSQEQLQLFIKYAPAALAMFDTEMCYVAVSQRWKDMFKLGDREILGLNQYDVFPDLPPHFKAAHQKGLSGQVVSAEADRYERADGTVYWTRWEIRPWFNRQGTVAGILLYVEDITERKQIESELRISATAFESQIGMMITDANAVILRVNQAFARLTGFAPAELIGKTPRVLRSGRHDADFYLDMQLALGEAHFWQGELWNRGKSSEVFPVLVSISAVLDEAGQVTHYVATYSDLSQHKQAEKLIERLSLYDALTSLPNRRYMLERLRQIVEPDRQDERYGAVLFVDLDDFSSLNDTRGHETGDLALVEIAGRLRECVPGDDDVARPSSDEFVVMLDKLATDAEQAALLANEAAQRLRSVINQPMQLGDTPYQCTASVGISLFRKGETRIDDLMRQADAAMYQVKRLGRDRIHFFDPAMQSALEERASLEMALRQAIPHELRLVYQMQVDDTGHVLGAESLIRWQTPDNGMVGPNRFIPLAEETGLILPMGRWVLETACRQLKQWETRPATRHLFLAVNVSARQFHQVDFVQEIVAVLDATGADPSRLKLELTESMLLEDTETVVAKMGELQKLGIRFSLDDFGTGFSSLSYLKRLPLDQLKIDQSFVRDVEKDANDAAIVRTVIALGQSLGINVIAEGVETEGQRNFLAVHGCKQYQGYLYGKPVAIEEFERALSA